MNRFLMGDMGKVLKGEPRPCIRRSDSGSPVFAEVDGQFQLFGIATSFCSCCLKRVDLSRAIMVQRYYNWVRAIDCSGNRGDLFVKVIAPKEHDDRNRTLCKCAAPADAIVANISKAPLE